jgi:hypothetical protein
MAARTGSEAQAMREVWARAVEEIKRTATSTTVYRALEKTIPIAWEDGFFAVGFSGTEGQLGAQLNTGEYRSIIERVLQGITGDPALKYRYVEGADYEDWEHLRIRDAASLAVRQQTMERRAVEVKAFTTWDDVYDQVSRLWASSEFRALPTGRARYWDAAFDIVLQAMASIYPFEGKADEPTERGLSRIIERIASMTGADAAIVAYLLFERRKSQPGS